MVYLEFNFPGSGKTNTLSYKLATKYTENLKDICLVKSGLNHNTAEMTLYFTT